MRVDAGAAKAVVLSGGLEYMVRFNERGARCTCPWFAQHARARGPCKHVLAAEIVRSKAVVR